MHLAYLYLNDDEWKVVFLINNGGWLYLFSYLSEELPIAKWQSASSFENLRATGRFDINSLHYCYKCQIPFILSTKSTKTKAKQESCPIANMTARCADKSKHKRTATSPPKITWLSVELDSVQPDVMNVGVERTFSPPKFLHASLEVGGWSLGEDVGLIVRAIRFQDFQPMWSWSTNVTDRRTDRRHAITRPRFALGGL